MVREPTTGNVTRHAGAPRPAPTLRRVYRGRGADELVRIDSDGRAVLLKGDGLTLEEAIWMRERALALLGGPNEP
jgi:hypothetical protein